MIFALCGYKNVCLLQLSLGLLLRNDQILPEIGLFGHFGPGLAGSFGVLLVGWLMVVVWAVFHKTLTILLTYLIVFHCSIDFVSFSSLCFAS